MLRFKGSQNLRQRLVCSTLSGRPIRVDDIRSSDLSPGLRDFEANLLRLIEKVTNGCVVEINETGTTLRYKPGLPTGGRGLVHDCGTSRAIGYFLEPLVCIALFGKKPLEITLRGITNDNTDPSVDVWRSVTLPLLRQLAGLEDARLTLDIRRRGAAPGGGGEVLLQVPVARAIPPVSLLEEGMVKRIRGIAHSIAVAPQATNRMTDGARGVLNALLADVYIFTDHQAPRRKDSGAEGSRTESPGYGCMLVAETTAGRLVSAECCSAQVGEAEVPEEVGQRAAYALLEEVSRGGCVDSGHQGLALLFAALGPRELAELRLGPLMPQAVRTLRTLRDFFGVTFVLKPENESKTIFASCIGAGVRNLSRRVS